MTLGDIWEVWEARGLRQPCSPLGKPYRGAAHGSLKFLSTDKAPTKGHQRGHCVAIGKKEPRPRTLRNQSGL